MSIIKARQLGFQYLKYSDEEKEPEKIRAINSLDLDVEPGEFIAVLGHNGSGKSTLAKHINALLLPTSGTIWIDGRNTAEEKELWKIRQKAGMVFQNPDNQIIGTVVEEDAGFGPENLGVPTEDIWKRVDDALTKVGMQAFREKSPNRLSGGQKQRVAIAGVVAMRPQCIVLDEPTAMLDPDGRREVLKVVRELNEKENVTVILITHYMEEVVWADRVYVMDKGDLVMTGTPREIFAQVDRLKGYRLDVPEVTELAYKLNRAGYPVAPDLLTEEELRGAILALAGPGTEKAMEAVGEAAKAAGEETEKDAASASGKTGEAGGTGVGDSRGEIPLLETRRLCHDYGAGTVYASRALDDISVRIGRGEFIALIGHTGSGKSTFIQHLNGLLKPTAGEVLWEGCDITDKTFDIRKLRTRVGLVFQYPEHQLFETTILADVCFGPKNQGLDKAAAESKARKALALTGIPESMYEESPFDISGGQKRRVAIAGVLAMNPQVLILDEPTAGLDPAGRDDILDCLKALQTEQGITILLVTHSMEDAARYADRLLVISDGRLLYDDTPRQVFRHYKALESIGLAAPRMTYLMHELKAAGLPVSAEAMTVDEAYYEILRVLERKSSHA